MKLRRILGVLIIVGWFIYFASGVNEPVSSPSPGEVYGWDLLFGSMTMVLSCVAAGAMIAWRDRND